MVITQRTKDVFVGQSIEIEVQIRNQSSEDLSVTVKLGSQLIEYTGEVFRNLRSNEDDTRKIKIAKGSGMSFLKISVSNFFFFKYVFCYLLNSRLEWEFLRRWTLLFLL